MSLHGETYERRLIWRHRIGQGFEWLCRIATMSALAVLIVLLGSIFAKAFSPGRGKGLAAVNLTKNSHSVDSDAQILFNVTNIKGGQFEEIDHPGKKIASFTANDLIDHKIQFDHSGKRQYPAFDLTVVSKSGEQNSEAEYKDVGSGNDPIDVPIPKIDQPAPAKPWGWLTWSFLTNGNSYDPLDAGIMVGLWGSIWLIGLTAIMVVPLGVGAAIYLEEYAKPTRLTKLIQLNIANLAGVPSIVYGILGFTVFSRMFGVFDSEAFALILNIWYEPIEITLPFGPVIISGACTLALLSLPVVIISSQEALRSVPSSLRHAAYALGSTKWQTIWHQVLPAALPGILTGVILSMSRAIGEAAPLAVIGVAAQLSYAPGRITSIGDVVQHPDKLIRAPFDRFTALPTQIYSWVNEASPNFENVAAAGILVLLAALLSMNGFAIFIRHRFQKKIQW